MKGNHTNHPATTAKPDIKYDTLEEYVETLGIFSKDHPMVSFTSIRNNCCKHFVEYNNRSIDRELRRLLDDRDYDIKAARRQCMIISNMNRVGTYHTKGNPKKWTKAEKKRMSCVLKNRWAEAKKNGQTSLSRSRMMSNALDMVEQYISISNVNKGSNIISKQTNITDDMYI